MHVTDLQTLYDYSCWMNDQILSAAGRVTPQQYSAATDLTPRNLHDNLIHILDVEWSWRERARGTPREVWIQEIKPADLPDVESLRARWLVESATMREYLANLTDEDLQTPFQLEREGVTLGDILLHMINHGLLARVEAAVLLTRYGQSPGDLDYLDYVDSLS